jgi:hypothetical protein
MGSKSFTSHSLYTVLHTDEMNLSQACDSIIISALHLFGAAYFSTLASQTTLAYPKQTKPDSNMTVPFLLYCFGAIVWCASSLWSWSQLCLEGSHAALRRAVEYGGVLALIWGSTLSVIMLFFDIEPLLQSSYLIASTWMFLVSITDLYTSSLDTAAIEARFPYLCARFGLLSLVPAFHTLVISGEKTRLAVEFLHMSLQNALGAGIYMICNSGTFQMRFLPRIGLVIMHVVLLQSIIMYAGVMAPAGGPGTQLNTV